MNINLPHLQKEFARFFGSKGRRCQCGLFNLDGNGIYCFHLFPLQPSHGEVTALDFYNMNCSVRPEFDKINDVPYIPRKMKRDLPQEEKDFGPSL
jgi:hypothetical protein